MKCYKMNMAVFKIAVIATLVTMTTSSMITPMNDMVTVRLGEPIQLSCVVTLGASESISEVRWYRDTGSIPYGSIDVTSGCGHVSSLMCPEEPTTDNRGIVRYETGTSNDPVLTLTINSSTLQDNTSFRCGIISGSQISSGISVTVYVPEATSPVPGHQTPLETTTTESTTTASTTRPITGEANPTTSPINATISGQTPSMVPTSIEPDPGFSPIMTTVVTTMTTVNTTTIIAVAVSACVVVIVILLVIIARLVSRNSRLSETKPTLLNLIAPAIDNQEMDAFRQARDTHAEHLYEGTLRRTRQQDVESSTNQQPPPVYATSINRKRQTACNDAPQYATPTRSQRQRDQYEDPEINTVEPGPDKAVYPSSETPRGDSPPDYTTIDPHSRPPSTVESGNLYTAVHMAGRHNQTEENASDQGSDVACPNAEIPQPQEYAQLEPDSEPQTAGVPEHSSPVYAIPKPALRAAAGDGTGTVNQDAGFPEHFSPEYAMLEPDAGVVDDESGTEPHEAGNPEHLSPEYAVLNPDTNAATDDGDEEELPTDAVYAQPTM